MNIIICGTIAAANEIVDAKARLEAMGHTVEIPDGVKNEFDRGQTEVEVQEKAEHKIKNELIKGYYKKIKASDAVLIVNVDKRDIPNYIGGNTFLEMGFAYVLDKPLYCLNPLPDLPYISEMLAMQPVILHSDLNNL